MKRSSVARIRCALGLEEPAVARKPPLGAFRQRSSSTIPGCPLPGSPPCGGPSPLFPTCRVAIRRPRVYCTLRPREWPTGILWVRPGGSLSTWVPALRGSLTLISCLRGYCPEAKSVMHASAEGVAHWSPLGPPGGLHLYLQGLVLVGLARSVDD
jgi:hypothetical protein